MNEQRPGMFIPALIGGVFAGILSGIPFINCLCCLWIIVGGIMAAYFLTKNSPAPLSASDGAIVGVFAGIIGAVVEFLISIPLNPINEAIYRDMMNKITEYTEDVPEWWGSMMEGGWETSIPFILIGLVINVVAFSVLGALGGIMGVSLFKKKSGPSDQGVIDVSKDQVQVKTSDNSQS